MKFVTQELNLEDKVCDEQADEEELVRRAQKDLAQFAVLYDRYVQRVYRFLLARTADVAEAEDLTSQTFLTAMQKLPSYRSNGHFLAWLFSIARNKQVDNFRKYQRRDVVELSENMAESHQDLVNDIIQKERRYVLKQILVELPERDYELLALRLAARMSFAEMGVYMHKNSENVKKAYYRLLERLKTRVEGSHE
ncbi:sigma-70 family RNA polymerase sigma factor [candidate division KSB1 bacterium]|nr:MAG: sigma-70 family RNA polymerase sigma factor [candidate division KSB1 bacterium]